MKNALRKIFISALALTFAIFPLFACADNDFEEYNPLPEIVIGGDKYLPFFYFADDGDFTGIDVELATEACRLMNCKPRFVIVDWADKDKCLDEGTIDCLWASFTRTDREELYSWSEPYMNSRQVVAVAEDSDIYSLADLKGKTVGVQSKTKPDDIFSGKSGRSAQIPAIKKLVCFNTADLMLASIREGYVDAIAGHETILIEHMKSDSMNLRILSESLEEVQLGVAFKKGTHAAVIERLNQALAIMQANGFVARTVQKYGLDPEKYTVVGYGRK